MKNKDKICCDVRSLISKALNTQYNWSIALLTLILWFFTGDMISYYNHSGFDMLINLHNYIQWLALGAIIIGLIKSDKQYWLLAQYGVIAYLLSVLTLTFSRNIFVTVYIAQLVLKPASIFFFFMIIKQVWELTNSAEESSKNIVKKTKTKTVKKATDKPKKAVAKTSVK